MLVKKSLWVLLIIFLSACSSGQPDEMAPTDTVSPSSEPAALLSPTPTEMPPELKGLRMAYIIDGNLYLQEGSDPPIQLTDDAQQDKNPVFSDDGEKVVFLRGDIPQDLYSINAVGGQEQLLVSGSVLSKLDLGYYELSEIQSFAFIPGTHQLLFNTCDIRFDDLKPEDCLRQASKSNNDLLLVDADTKKIMRLLEPGQGGNFAISPDGKFIAVQGPAQIAIVELDGEIHHRDLIYIDPRQRYEGDPVMNWTEDGSEVIVTLPVGLEVAHGFIPDVGSVLRYPIDRNSVTEIRPDPPVLTPDYTVSPDGNWILYNYSSIPGETDESFNSGLYLQSLTSLDSQLVLEGTSTSIWSQDSSHFLYEAQEGLYLGMPEGQSELIANEGRILGWADADHFLYYAGGMITMRGLEGKTFNFPAPSSGSEWADAFTHVYTYSDPNQVLPTMPAPTATPPPPERITFTVVTDEGNFVEETTIAFMNSDGTGLEFPLLQDQIFMGSRGYIAWSPDGRYLAFDGGDKFSCDNWGTNGHGCYHINYGTYVTDFAQDAILYHIEDTFSNVSWSPDSQHLALPIQEKGESRTHDLHILDVISGNLQKLTSGTSNDLYPSWSPDGEWIAFVRFALTSSGCDSFHTSAFMSEECRNHASLYRIRPDGSDLQLLYAPIFINEYFYWNYVLDNAPAWSPDSRWLAFLIKNERGLHDHSDLAIINVETGERQEITSGNGVTVSPTWSPDGQQLAFSSGPVFGADVDIYLWDMELNRIVNITNTFSGSLFPVWSFSGNQIAFLTDSDLSIMYTDGTKWILLDDESLGRVLGIPAWQPDLQPGNDRE